MARPDDTELIAAWCEQHLGSPPSRELFRTGPLSVVLGVVLADGRGVVVKVRPWSDRLPSVVAVHAHLHAHGFPCPEPLAGPAPLGARCATAEQLLPRRDPPPDVVPSDAMADLLAELVDRAPPASAQPMLHPAPPWAGWDHPGAGTWPWPDDLDVDLNDHGGPAWVDETARRVRMLLATTQGPPTIGHADWEAHNVDWSGDRPVAVHDWDSVAIRPDATLAGIAAAVHPSNGALVVAATVEQTAAFLDAYRRHRPRWTADDDRSAWASGLWVLAYNAKKETVGGGRGYLDHLRRELDERRRLAGC